ncbi:D-amino-acid transaminase [Gracilibacillus thailandensis]|uniref:D-alanine aminotransferase n=1 Tax=Gracilibacillus thailandensis TaxID=563735 RepID=A0A6N7QZV6_9BACI|nr:D-amino-acid transaminase [Gracilibacillus thailandensis]MRI67617.1 D-amino-acid transaminase [Gracilibacillus thailandensis]
MTDYMLWNHEIVERKAENAMVSFEDRGYQFGDGVYEVIRIYDGKLHALDWHLDRLFYSMEQLAIRAPFSRSEIKQLLKQLTETNKFTADGKLYLQVTRGMQPRDHVYMEELDAIFYATVDCFDQPVEMWEKGVKVTLQEDIRWLRCDIKSLNLLGNVLARTKAQRNGYHEPLFHRDGIVRECGASNFYMIKDGVIHTHPTNNYILGGITRKKVLMFAEELAIPVEEREITVEELQEADECFLTATPLEIVPITQIDHQPIDHNQIGKITKRLQQYYRKRVYDFLE